MQEDLEKLRLIREKEDQSNQEFEKLKKELEYITELNGPPLEAFTKLYNLGAIDSACVFIAERSGKKEKLESMGVSLKPAGERISHYVNSGYTVLTF